MSKAYLQGRPRDAAPGKRPWRVRAYSPGPGFPRGRVVFKDAETGKLATRTPDDGQTLEQLFDLVERALSQNVALARNVGSRDLTALADRYLEWLRGQSRDPDYINNRRSLLNKWLLREHGDVPVGKWGPQLSVRVIAAARKSVGSDRVEDLGGTLSGLRSFRAGLEQEGAAGEDARPPRHLRRAGDTRIRGVMPRQRGRRECRRTGWVGRGDG
jgi:hypothetical protein